MNTHTHKYVAVLEPDLEVGGYTATIPELPGCVSEGDTIDEALRNVADAAALYLEPLDLARPIQPEVVVRFVEVPA